MNRFIVVSFMLLVLLSPLLCKDEIRVGIYQNPPKISLNERGNPVGIWPDLIQAIAETEKWEITWISGTWEECLNKLEMGDIDVMPDVGITPERKNRFLFSREIVYLSWVRLYKRKGVDILSILDLEGKKVAGLKGSFDLEGADGLKAILKKFEVKCEILELDSYSDVFQAVKNGKADAALTDKLYGDSYYISFNLHSTAVLLHPAQMTFAYNKLNPNSPLLASKFDSNIKKIKSKEHSILSQSFEKYFPEETGKTRIPAWVHVLNFIVLGILVTFSIFNRILKRTVKEKTKLLQEDIQVRKKAEVALIESEAQYKALIEQAGDAIFKGDHNGNIIQVNSACEKLTGYTPTELLRMNIKDLFHKQVMAKQPLRYDILQKGKSLILERKMKQKSGSIIVVEMNSKMLFDGNYLSIIRDMTSRNLAQLKLKESELQLRTLFKTMREIVLEIDYDGTYVNIAPTSDELLIDERHKMMGKKMHQFLPEDTVNICMEKIRFSLDSGYSSIAEYPLFIKGNELWFEARITPKTKKTVLFLAIDITRKMKTEKELQQHKEQLEELVEARTRELKLTNEQLSEFNQLFVGREFRIKELRDKIKKLEGQLAGKSDKIS